MKIRHFNSDQVNVLDLINKSLSQYNISVAKEDLLINKVIDDVRYLAFNTELGGAVATYNVNDVPKEFDVEFPKKWYIDGNSANGHIYICKEQANVDEILSNPENKGKI